MKRCSSCLQEKAATEFQVRRLSKDGRTASCRICLRKRDAARYGKEREKRNEWSRRYYRTIEGRQVVNRSKRKWQEANLIKRAVHILVGNAIRDGKVVKGDCEKCGSSRVHAHHEDYSKPFEIRWLCAKHHVERHKELDASGCRHPEGNGAGLDG